MPPKAKNLSDAFNPKKSKDVPIPTFQDLQKLGGKESSVGISTPTNTLELWNPKFVTVELGRQVTTTDSSWDHNNYLALAQAVMLPQDMADLATEDSMKASDLMTANEKLATSEKALGNERNSCSSAMVMPLIEVTVAQDQRDKALHDLVELQKTAALPEAVLLDLPEPYFPMKGGSANHFNEEKYANQPIEREAKD
ncbi:hypothetical protein Acr_20g0004640 [Actinidia rufa]|uniref:Uncharacterized protein n=1 Tax=Actinidia rufa TaxID=165716 RepID=A0A7J0GCW0_9ERIC|nr:hypothetical protein Acr_20g0004640 [Actinidia rufa]